VSGGNPEETTDRRRKLRWRSWLPTSCSQYGPMRGHPVHQSASSKATEMQITYDSRVRNAVAGGAAREELLTPCNRPVRYTVRSLADSSPDVCAVLISVRNRWRKGENSLCEHLFTNLIVIAFADEAAARATARTMNCMLELGGGSEVGRK
jgi:hypothetical protein